MKTNSESNIAPAMHNATPPTARELAIIYAQVHLMDAEETLRHMRLYVCIERRVLRVLEKSPHFPHIILKEIFGRLIARDQRLEDEIVRVRTMLARTNALLQHASTPAQAPAITEKAA